MKSLILKFLLVSVCVLGLGELPKVFAQSEEADVIAVLNLENSFKNYSPEVYERERVINFLKAEGAKSLRSLTAFLQKEGVLNKGVRINKFHWINTSVYVRVNKEGLRILALSPSVSKLYRNQKFDRKNFSKRKPIRGKVDLDPKSEINYHLRELGLDRLYEEFPKIQGKGVLVGHFDSGVDGTHPLLKGKVVKFYNSVRKQLEPAHDFDSHGTHTAGTILGGDRDQNWIGVAPQAKLIATGPIDDFDVNLEAMEFLLDPDKNPKTNDYPRVINNSWHMTGAPDIDLFYRAISAWEASGILPVFSAGNAGPDPKTITTPHEHPAAFTVAAYGKNGKILKESSRGPAIYNGKVMQKPDISAPGEEIISASPGGGLEAMDLTSASAPQATGAAALLFQVEPKLTPSQVRKILITSATSVDANGNESKKNWNPNFGFGKLNVYKAIQLLLRAQRRFQSGEVLGRSAGVVLSPEFFLNDPEDQSMDWIFETKPPKLSDVYF